MRLKQNVDVDLTPQAVRPGESEAGIPQEFLRHELVDVGERTGYFDRIVLVEVNGRLYGAAVSAPDPARAAPATA